MQLIYPIRKNYKPKYQIGLCQRFTKSFHGFDEESSPDICDHYLCVFLFQYQSDDDLNFALSVEDNSREQYNQKRTCEVTKITIEIVETFVLEPGYETVAIYKTFWLRIFQRKVKKWIALKKSVRSVVKTNKIDKMLLDREISGKNLRYYFSKLN